MVLAHCIETTDRHGSTSCTLAVLISSLWQDRLQEGLYLIGLSSFGGCQSTYFYLFWSLVLSLLEMMINHRFFTLFGLQFWARVVHIFNWVLPRCMFTFDSFIACPSENLGGLKKTLSRTVCLWLWVVQLSSDLLWSLSICKKSARFFVANALLPFGHALQCQFHVLG